MKVKVNVRRYDDGRVVAMQGHQVDAFYFVLFGRRTHALANLFSLSRPLYCTTAPQHTTVQCHPMSCPFSTQYSVRFGFGSGSDRMIRL